MSSASGKYSNRSRHKRGKGAMMHKGNRRAHRGCKVKRCLLEADHRGVCYFGVD